jgi:hypothetical protein
VTRGRHRAGDQFVVLQVDDLDVQVLEGDLLLDVLVLAPVNSPSTSSRKSLPGIRRGKSGGSSWLPAIQESEILRGRLLGEGRGVLPVLARNLGHH